MKIRSWKAYLAITAVGGLSYLVMSFGPDKDFIQEIASIPFVGALVAALFVMLRDHASYERALAIQDRKNNFIVGANSHMANVAFDKHVEFAEEYVAEAEKILPTLFAEGPSKKALDYADKLYKIEKEHRVWLTMEIEDRLDEFDQTLRKVGALANYEERTGSLNEEKNKEMYRLFSEIVGIDVWDGDPASKDKSTRSLIRWLRGILGIEELTDLRKAIVSKAAEEIA